MIRGWEGWGRIRSGGGGGEGRGCLGDVTFQILERTCPFLFVLKFE